MKRSYQLTVSALVVAFAVATAGCSSSGGNKTVGTAGQPATAQAAFCDDLGSYLPILDRYGRIFTQNQLTVGQLQTGAQELEAARAKVESSAGRLADAITAANTAATAVPGSAGTTTTVLASMTADDHIKAIDQAQKDLDKTIAGVDASTPVTQAAADSKPPPSVSSRPTWRCSSTPDVSPATPTPPRQSATTPPACSAT